MHPLVQSMGGGGCEGGEDGGGIDGGDGGGDGGGGVGGGCMCAHSLKPVPTSIPFELHDIVASVRITFCGPSLKDVP